MAKSDEGHLKFALPGSAELIKLMHAEMNDPYRRITRLYWVVSRTSIRGIVEQVRTSLAELIAEMVAVMADDQDVPSKEAADQAVNFIVSGKRHNITVVSSHAATGGTSSVETNAPATEPDTWWRRWRKRGLIIGLSTVVAAAAAVATWLEWAPWK